MNHTVVSKPEWLEARKVLLAKEKEFTHARDALSAERRNLPWVRIDKQYVFDGPNGEVPLGDLFAGRSQLIVYHLIFAPEWDAACKSCSFWADNFERYIDLLPKGRDEADGIMSWLRRRDEYDAHR